MGKFVAKTWNSAVDINANDGVVTIFNTPFSKQKSATNFGIDLGFNYFKLGVETLSNKPPDDVKLVFDLMVDQVKYGTKEAFK